MRIKTVHVARTRIDFVRSEHFQPQLYAVLTSPVPKMRWAWNCVPSMAAPLTGTTHLSPCPTPAVF